MSMLSWLCNTHIPGTMSYRCSSCTAKVLHHAHNQRRRHAHENPCFRFLGQSHESVQGSYVERKVLNPCNVVTCKWTTSTPLSNWVSCDRTCSISVTTITTSYILPQFLCDTLESKPVKCTHGCIVVNVDHTKPDQTPITLMMIFAFLSPPPTTDDAHKLYLHPAGSGRRQLQVPSALLRCSNFVPPLFP